jgi:hypothetical protein
MLQPFKSKSKYKIQVSVLAKDEAEAKEMQAALQSFVGHFNTQEMKKAAEKLKSASNRALLKTFL